MKNFTFENQGTNTYLVYQIEDNDTVDSMSLGMLVNNKIPGLAAAMFTQMDTTKYIKYNVSSRVTAQQFFSGAVNKKRLLGVFSGIVNAFLSAEDYMIDKEAVILDLDYIFADVSTCDTILICLPLEQQNEQCDLGAFFKGIMFTTQFDQTENCDYVAHIINYLNSAPTFSLVDFKKLIEKEETDISSTPEARSVVTPVATSAAQNMVSEPKVRTVINNQTAVNNQYADNNQSVFNNILQPQQKSGFVKPVQIPPVQQKNAVQVPPPASEQVPKVQVTQKNGTASEKKMGMFGLLTHYSKENAELYKQQKAAKKASKVQPPVQPPAGQPVQPTAQQFVKPDIQPATQSAPAKTKSKKKQKQKQAPVNSGFAVPGQNNNQGFAIPGQPVSMASSMSAQSVPLASSAPSVAASPAGQPVQQFQVQQPQAGQAFQEQCATVAPQQQPTYVRREVVQGQAANFGETTVLGGGMIGETTVLTAEQNPNKMIAPHLVRKKNNEKISLNKPVFRVGKERSYVDYFIGDNTAISRSHANFIIRDGEYFVVDTNSTNHTFVNGTMIQSNVETLISHGDVVRLANEDFDFKLY